MEFQVCYYEFDDRNITKPCDSAREYIAYPEAENADEAGRILVEGRKELQERVKENPERVVLISYIDLARVGKGVSSEEEIVANRPIVIELNREIGWGDEMLQYVRP